MTDDLVRRLRSVSANPIYLLGTPGTTPGNVLASEAADRIEDLENARRKTFQALLRTTKIHDEAEAYAAELEAALKLHQDLDAISVAAVNSLTAQLAQAVEGAFVEGFFARAGDGWVNNPHIEDEWRQSRTRATLAEIKGEKDE